VGILSSLIRSRVTVRLLSVTPVLLTFWFCLAVLGAVELELMTGPGAAVPERGFAIQQLLFPLGLPL
jgi:hypothetical protein